MSKYNNRKTEVDGIPFDSAKEALRYQELKLLESAGLIRHLKLQYAWELQPGFKRDGKKERPITYICDFCYMDAETGKTIVEDVKGVKTQAYAIKKKLLLFKYPHITFLET